MAKSDASGGYKRIKLAVFDWAGTMVDHGCMAPVIAFRRVFQEQGVEISLDQARGPMGMEKKAHIRAVADMTEVAGAWREAHGRPVEEKDIDDMFHRFVPLLLDELRENSTTISGVPKAVDRLRSRGVKIGATTGYFQEAANIVADVAALQGYIPDCSINASQVNHGRPSPWMIYRVMEKLEIYPPWAVVNVGDTIVDVAAGVNAGVWSVGVSRTGNLCGLSVAEMESLGAAERQALIAASAEKLAGAGAHYVLECVSDFPRVLDEINGRLEAGEKP